MSSGGAHSLNTRTPEHLNTDTDKWYMQAAMEAHAIPTENTIENERQITAPTPEVAPTPTPASEAEPAQVAGIVPRAFWTPKAGNSETDYEDGWAAGTDCVAIADGATESSFARLWAQALTAGFVAQPAALFPLHTERLDQCRARLQDWTQPLQAEWHARVPWKSLPWFAEDKARSGAFATLLMFKTNDERGMMSEEGKTEDRRQKAEAGELSTLNSQPSTFQALAIGDSCLFQIREGRVKLAFPLETSAEFDSRPLLLSSNPANNKRVWEELAFAEGTFAAGDILLFATDALARWFLAEVEQGNRPWDALCGLQTQEAFETLVTRLRHERVMRNDDVTLVIVDASHVASRVETTQRETASFTPEMVQREALPSTPEPQPETQRETLPQAETSLQTGTTPQEDTPQGETLLQAETLPQMMEPASQPVAVFAGGSETALLENEETVLPGSEDAARFGSEEEPV